MDKKESDDIDEELLKKMNDAVNMVSLPAPDDAVEIRGYDFNNGINYEAMFKSFISTGFQATALAQAIDTINAMIKWRLSDDPIPDNETDYWKDPEVRKNYRC